MKIAEIPITTKKTRPSRLFRNPFDYAIKAWINILRIYRDFEPIKFFGIIGTLIFTVGFGFGIWIIINLINTGAVGGIPRVILSGLFVTTGIQIILFGFLADMLKK